MLSVSVRLACIWVSPLTSLLSFNHSPCLVSLSILQNELCIWVTFCIWLYIGAGKESVSQAKPDEACSRLTGTWATSCSIHSVVLRMPSIFVYVSPPEPNQYHQRFPERAVEYMYFSFS